MATLWVAQSATLLCTKVHARSGCLAALLLFTAGGLVRAAPPIAASSASSAGGSVLFVVETAAAHEVREIGADGGGERVIRALPSSFGYAGWSPTRTAIAFTNGRDELFVMRISDGRTTLVAPSIAPLLGSSVAWSPDGQQLAYIAGSKGLQIFIVNADGTGRRRIAGGHTWTISGSRGGSAFGSSPDSRGVIYIDYHALAWSPDKRNLVYLRRVRYDSRHPAASARLYLLSADGRRGRKLARLRPFVPRTLAWAPDSAKVAVGGYRDSGVMTVSTRGKTKKYVTQCCVGVYDLAWSRDGKKIILFSDGSAGPDGAIVNPDGSQLRILHINGHEPAWSPDSQRIAFTDGSDVLHIINANGTGLRTLTDAPGVIGPTWK
jgi:Tol biopolymer transport system component